MKKLKKTKNEWSNQKKVERLSHSCVVSGLNYEECLRVVSKGNVDSRVFKDFIYCAVMSCTNVDDFVQ